MSSNSVTLAELQKLARSLAATPAKLQRGLEAATKEIRVLVTDEFNESRNPWGRAWAPQKVQTNRLLIRTGELVDSIRIDTVGNSIVTKIGAPYSRYLQRGRRRLKTKGAAASVIHEETLRGTSKSKLLKQRGLSEVGMRPRTIIPFNKLPPTWQLAIVQSLTSEFEKVA